MPWNVFLRILLAVLVVVALNLVIPPLFRLIGFPLSSDLSLIITVCMAAAALWYVITGGRPGPVV